ncbi:MAG TPA: MetQ/NlpA family ABC transporter substrate-binding protein [Candidatus Aquicultor sp.]|jgi:NitT/TauT family transport system substrate-binding protein
MKRIIAGLVILALMVIGAGCAKQGTQSSTANSSSTTQAKNQVVKVRVGTLPIEDALPIFVAQQKGLFKDKDLDIELTVFKSAQERDAALQAGQIDAAVGDMVAVGALKQSGTDISVVSVLLGATPAEGRFGILVPPQATDLKTVDQIKGVPIAISSNTIIEYTVDELLKSKGFKDTDIRKVEIKAMPVRVDALVNGQVRAASLPDPLLSFAVSKGARVIIDDTKGANLSQVVLIFRNDFIDANKAAVKSMLSAQNDAVKLINENPDAYRQLLVDKAKLPAPIAKTYKINTYPTAQLPAKADVDRLLKWMETKKIIKPGLTYDDIVNKEVKP